MNFSLKVKLGGGFGVLLAVLAAMGFVSYYSTASLVGAAQLANSELAKRMLATQIDFDIKQQSLAAHDYVLGGLDEALRRDEKAQRDYSDHVQALGELLTSVANKDRLDRVRQSHAEYRKIADREIELRQAHKQKEATDLAYSANTSAIKKVATTALTELEAEMERRSKAGLESQRSAESRSKTLTLTLVMLGMVVGLLIASFTARSVVGTTTRMVTLVQELAANNLAVEDMEITSQDEIGQAGKSLNEMKNNLRELIQAIAGTAEHVASASEEISSSASQQAQGAETQKDQTSQAATAMQEMSSTVQQVSENSSRAADASRQAAETARRGGAIVNETLAKMRIIADSVGATAKKVEELGKSSDQIGRIIGVIDDIADQTNLLALNAAIEAARAGEQGRGFAVVADEVRKLAERTTSATKEIAQMIRTVQEETKTAVSAMEEGTKQVEEGVTTTAQAGDSLKEIIHTSEEVGGMITQIATAATEQSSATEEINNNMEQIARLVKESADGAQQSAKACQDLSGLALDLQKMVSNFRLGNEQRDFHSARRTPQAVVHRESVPRAKAASAG